MSSTLMEVLPISADTSHVPTARANFSENYIETLKQRLIKIYKGSEVIISNCQFDIIE